MGKLNWRLVLTLGAMAVAAVAALASNWYANHFIKVHLVNGLSQPVLVEVAGQQHRVASGERVEVGPFSPGPLELVTRREDGKEVERVTANIAPGVDVYNVLGAAPVERSNHFYIVTGSKYVEPEVYTSCAGPSFQVHGVQHAFRALPATVRSKSNKTEILTAVTLWDGGLRACLDAFQVEPLALGELALRVLAVTDDPEERRTLLRAAGQTFILAGKPERTVELLEPRWGLDAESEADDVMLQELAVATGQHQRAMERYRQRYQREKSPEATYLYTRLLPLDQALALVDKELRTAPEEDWLLSQKWDALEESARWPEVEKVARWYLEQPDLESRHDSARESVAVALAAQGQDAEALALLKAALDPRPSWTLAQGILVDRLARKMGTVPWTDVVGRVSGLPPADFGREQYRHYFQVSAGRDRVPPPSQAAVAASELLQTARTNPQRALASLVQFDLRRNLFLTPEHVWLLLAEAWRVGDEKAVARLYRFLGYTGDSLALRRFISEGGDETALRSVPLDGRRALYLARYRALRDQHDESGAAAMRARLEASDPLRGLAVLALLDWEQRDPSAVVQEVREVKQAKRPSH